MQYQIITPRDGRYGSKSKHNQRWDGMVGMVLDNVGETS